MLGFVNGLAIVIGISQLSQFKTINALGESVWVTGNTLLIPLYLSYLRCLLFGFCQKLQNYCHLH